MDDGTRTIRPDELLAQMGWMRELARGLVADPQRAEDVAQDAWLAATTRPPAHVEGERGLRAWLATVVRNLARKGARAHGRRQQREAAVARPEAQASTLDVVARGALHHELSSAVMELREPLRSAVLLRYLDGLDAKEIARRQGVSHAAARQRVSRGLSELRARMDAEHDGDRAAWSMALLALVDAPAPAGAAAGALPTLISGGLAVFLKSTLVAATAVLLTMFLLPFLRSDPARDVAGGEARERPMLTPADRSSTDVAGLGDDARRALDARITVTVVDEGGAPRADVLALWLADGALVAATRTDAAGVASTTVGATPDELLLARTDLVPLRVALDGSRARRVVLAAGATVAGRVVVDDGREPPALRLSHDRPAFSVEGLAREVLDALGREGVGASGSTLALDPGGRFRAVGLASDWTGALELPGQWRFAASPSVGAIEDGRALLLLAPASGLELTLAAPSSFTGLVVATESGLPVEGARVRGRIVPEGGLVPAPVEVHSDAQGRFAFELATRQYAGTRWRLEVAATSVADGPESARVIWASELPVDGALGRFELEPGRTLGLSVRDEAGAPVCGAHAHVSGPSGGDVEVTTDQQGQATLFRLPRGAERGVVSAPGFAPRRFVVPPAGARGGAAVQVELAASNELVVRVVDEGGRPLVGSDLRVECAVLPFDVPVSYEDVERHDALGAFRERFQLDEEGVLRLSALAPGCLLTLTVLDEHGGELVQRDVATPAALERRTVELAAGGSPISLVGRVVDPNGRGLPRATIYVEGAGAAFETRSDADGRFAFGPLWTALEGLHVEVRRPGYLTAVLREYAVDASTPPLEVTLEVGRSLDVLVLDPDGRSVGDVSLRVEFPDRPVAMGKERPSGGYRFESIARADGELVAVLGGVELRAPLASDVASVRFELPPTGALELEVDPAERLKPGARLCAVIEALDHDAEPTRRYFHKSAEGPAPLTLPLLAGRYRLQLEQRVLGRRADVQSLGAPMTLEIGAGSLRRVVLP